MILALNLVQVLLVKTPGIVLKPPAGAQLQTAQRSIKLLCYGTQEVLTNPGVLPRPGSLYTHASATYIGHIESTYSVLREVGQ